MKYTKKSRILPTFEYEERLWRDDYLVIGVDEVGRGSLAGPVYAGAVCFDSKEINLPAGKAGKLEIEKFGINDSKKLKANERKRLAKIIKKTALTYSIGFSDVSVVNKLGIVKATKIAIRKAVAEVIKKISATYVRSYISCNLYLLLDAFNVTHVKSIGLKNQLVIIKGDEKSISIAAASIVAKVERDQIMSELHHKYPIYLWNRNKGYGTRAHIEALKKFGRCKLHRDLFLRKIIF